MILGFGSGLRISEIIGFQRKHKFIKKKRFDDNTSIPPLTADKIDLTKHQIRIDEAKGGEFLGKSLKEKFNSKRNVVFMIIGNTSGDYGRKVENLFNCSENRIIRLETKKYEQLPMFYQMADLCVYPKQASLSFYDAQATGLPVLTEAKEINISRLENGNGLNFNPDDINDFREKILFFSNLDASDYEIYSNNALKYVLGKYDYKSLTKRYLKIMDGHYE
jgi:glycosyltransferase involved in cell wall biosynthesis